MRVCSVFPSPLSSLSSSGCRLEDTPKLVILDPLLGSEVQGVACQGASVIGDRAEPSSWAPQTAGGGGTLREAPGEVPQCLYPPAHQISSGFSVFPRALQEPSPRTPRLRSRCGRAAGVSASVSSVPPGAWSLRGLPEGAGKKLHSPPQEWLLI